MKKTIDLDIPRSAEERVRLQRTFHVGHEARLLAENEQLRNENARLREEIARLQIAQTEG